MSDSLPKPLSSITALRAHLKLLERGVLDARSARTGPVPAAITVPAMRPQPPMQRQAPTAIPINRSTEGSDGKPKAKAKSGVDFGAFFGNADKRAAG